MGSAALETQTLVPRYSYMWRELDNTSAFRFQKICHKVMQWQRRKLPGASPKRTRWIMKTPEYAGFLPQVLKVYPDAKILLTHRDPVAVMSSFIPLVAYMSGFWNSILDAEKMAEYTTHSCERRFTQVAENIDTIPKEQVMHIPFADFLQDNFKVIEKACKFADLSLDDEALKLMKDYIAKSPREGGTRFEYRLSTFGPQFTKEKVRARFSKYSEKFAQYI
jgi:Sulfotransferase family